jgi:hypothetical protein
VDHARTKELALRGFPGVSDLNRRGGHMKYRVKVTYTDFLDIEAVHRGEAVAKAMAEIKSGEIFDHCINDPEFWDIITTREDREE